MNFNGEVTPYVTIPTSVFCAASCRLLRQVSIVATLSDAKFDAGVAYAYEHTLKGRVQRLLKNSV